MNCYYCGDIATRVKKIQVVYFTDSIDKVVKPLCDNHYDKTASIR